MTAATDGTTGTLGIGARLRAARERAGLTLLQAAERLHVDPRLLESLESESFEELGAAVYARGHVRRYAELVGESPGELQQLYDLSQGAGAVPDLRRIPAIEKPPVDARRFIAPVGIALTVAAFTGVIWWILSASRRPATPEIARGEAAVTVPAPAGPSALARAAPPGAPAAGGAGSSSRPQSAAVPAQSRVSGPATGAPRASQLDGQGETEIRLRFVADSWTEVYEAGGNRLYFDVGAANTAHTFRGKPPLRVVLGNAPGVAVTVNGRSTVIPPRAMHSAGARFLVYASGVLAPSR